MIGGCGPGPLALYAGRIAPEKGIVLLADAFEIVRAQRPDAQLMVVGDYMRYPRIRRALERTAEGGQVMLLGERPRVELGACYQMADYFCFPSLTDTQALVLHEAALAGLPIVSVDHELQLVLRPGVNGELARPTPTSLAAGMLRVIDALERPGWAAQAGETSVRLASQWSTASQAAVMLSIYEDLACRRVWAA